LPLVQAELERAGIWRAEWAGAEKDWFAHTVDLLRPRTHLLTDFAKWSLAFFSDTFEYDPAAKEKFWKDARLAGMLGKLADALAAIPEWNHDSCEHALRGIAETEGVKAGLLINATRVAIVGQAVAPPLFETMLVLGRERVVRRLRAALPATEASANAAG
jgi:glutamyl-tRNA synthetase